MNVYFRTIFIPIEMSYVVGRGAVLSSIGLCEVGSAILRPKDDNNNNTRHQTIITNLKQTS